MLVKCSVLASYICFYAGTNISILCIIEDKAGLENCCWTKLQIRVMWNVDESDFWIYLHFGLKR